MVFSATHAVCAATLLPSGADCAGQNFLHCLSKRMRLVSPDSPATLQLKGRLESLKEAHPDARFDEVVYATARFLLAEIENPGEGTLVKDRRVLFELGPQGGDLRAMLSALLPNKKDHARRKLLDKLAELLEGAVVERGQVPEDKLERHHVVIGTGTEDRNADWCELPKQEPKRVLVRGADALKAVARQCAQQARSAGEPVKLTSEHEDYRGLIERLLNDTKKHWGDNNRATFEVKEVLLTTEAWLAQVPYAGKKTTFRNHNGDALHNMSRDDIPTMAALNESPDGKLFVQGFLGNNEALFYQGTTMEAAAGILQGRADSLNSPSSSHWNIFDNGVKLTPCAQDVINDTDQHYRAPAKIQHLDKLRSFDVKQKTRTDHGIWEFGGKGAQRKKGDESLEDGMEGRRQVIEPSSAEIVYTNYRAVLLVAAAPGSVCLHQRARNPRHTPEVTLKNTLHAAIDTAVVGKVSASRKSSSTSPFLTEWLFSSPKQVRVLGVAIVKVEGQDYMLDGHGVSSEHTKKECGEGGEKY